MKIDITPLILTYNEEANIARTLAELSWASQIVIVDSGSTDKTLELARSVNPNVRIAIRKFDDHTNQWNFGLDQVTSSWVLSLDADYVVRPEFVKEIEQLNPSADVTGYSSEFKYCIARFPLRSSVYPPRTVLFRRDCSRYYDDGHTQRLRTNGRVLPLKTKIDHDDRKPFSRWFKEQCRYARIEAKYLLTTPFRELPRQDRLRRTIVFASSAMFFYLLFGRGLILDGWRGWYYVFQRTVAEVLLSKELIAEEFRNRS